MRKRKHLFGAVLLTLGILFGGFWFSENSTQAAAEQTISNTDELYQALENGGVYTIIGDISTSQQKEDNPIIVKKATIFKGGSISLNSGGILMGADVTFSGTTIEFKNSAYMGIFANGHNLTLDAVTLKWGYPDPLSISAGGVENNPLFSASTGSESTITLNNVTISSTASVTQGLNLYAGNVYNITPSEYNNSAPLQPNQDTGVAFPVVVDIRGSKTNSNISLYGHGATYTGFKQGNINMAIDQYDKIAPSTDCRTTGGVCIALQSGTGITSIDGATGVENVGAVVQFTSVNGYSASLTAMNIGGIELNKNGGASPKLTLKNGGYSSFYANANVVVPEDTLLNLAQLESSLSINDFTGGGSLVLGQSQCLTINGQVTDQTKVGILDITMQGGKLPTNNHTYIQAPQSSEASFELVPPNTHPKLQFTNIDGKWGVYTSEDSGSETAIAKIESISVPDDLKTVVVSPGLQTEYTGLDIKWAEDVDEVDAQLGRIPL
ncbi:MAG: hypothetical protein ACI4DN_06765, partial [Lachnospiraceae bacterium]